MSVIRTPRSLVYEILQLKECRPRLEELAGHFDRGQPGEAGLNPRIRNSRHAKQEKTGSWGRF